MIGGENGEIPGHHAVKKTRQLGVEPLQRPRIAGNVVSVPELTVELNEVGKGQGPARGFPREIAEMPEKYPVGAGTHLRNSPHREDITDLPDGVDLPTGLVQPVAKRRFRWPHGEIPAVRRADEAVLRRAGERARDHPANPHRMQCRRKRQTEVEEPPEPETLLMGRDLEYTVGRSVADRPARPDMFGSLLLQDQRAAGSSVAENAFRAGQPTDFGHEIIRKTRGGVREAAPVPGNGNTGEFPMTGRCVLAVGHFRRRAPESSGVRPKPRHPLPRGKLEGTPETKAVQIGNSQNAATALVGFPHGTGPRDMTERVRAEVAIRFRIRRAAAAKGIEDQQERTSHQANVP